MNGRKETEVLDSLQILCMAKTEMSKGQRKCGGRSIQQFPCCSPVNPKRENVFFNQVQDCFKPNPKGKRLPRQMFLTVKKQPQNTNKTSMHERRIMRVVVPNVHMTVSSQFLENKLLCSSVNDNLSCGCE